MRWGGVKWTSCLIIKVSERGSLPHEGNVSENGQGKGGGNEADQPVATSGDEGVLGALSEGEEEGEGADAHRIRRQHGLQSCVRSPSAAGARGVGAGEARGTCGGCRRRHLKLRSF